MFSNVIGMVKSRRVLPVLVVAVLALAFAVSAPKIWASNNAQVPVPFSEAQLAIEINDTDGDAGIRGMIDGDPWKRVQIIGPDGRRIMEIKGAGNLKKQGITELSFESAEPNFSEFSLAQFLRRFPEGDYPFKGLTLDNEDMAGMATFTHDLPDAPVIVSPADGAVVDPTAPIVLSWDPVTTPAGIQIDVYEVVLDGGDDGPGMTVEVPSTTTSVTVPPELVLPGTEYDFEVLAREVSGNQVITEHSFETQ